jgi:glycosyltransferase involved in cell wall biosynthesis
MSEYTDYPDDHIEELYAEIHELREGNAHLTHELNTIYGSVAYRTGSAARTVLREPATALKIVRRIARTTKLLRPETFRNLRKTPPTNSFITNAEYKKWQRTFEPKSKDLAEQRKHAKTLKKQPLFSIITPVFKPPEAVLVELIESVLKQTYGNFELCLGEFSGDKTTRRVLKTFAEQDSRIKIKFFDDNDGISINSNRCLDMATGEYVCLLDHDDTLSPDALYENALLLNEKDYDFIYSDKDKIDEAGNRFDPMFKPDWSPEIMITANYLTHFNVFKKSIVEEIGRWDKETDGAQDWDLFLRIIEKSKLIGHIPKILYHWRVIATSTALSISTKPYALEGQKKAIHKHIASLGIDQPTVHHEKNGALSLEWGSAPMKAKRVHCIITTDTENYAHAKRLARKLTKSSVISKDNITINDTNNEKQLAQTITKHRSKNDIILFIDAQVTMFNRKNWLEELVGWLSIPGVGIAAPQTYNKYGVFLEAGRVIGLGSSATPLFAGETYLPGVFGYREWSRNTTLPSMSCFAVNTSALSNIDVLQQGVQGLREVALTSALNGYRAVVTPFVSVTLNTTSIHEPPMSEKNTKDIKKLLPQLRDPYFSENIDANTQYISFNTEKSILARQKIIQSQLDKPIGYDPNVTSKATDDASETFPLVGYRRDAYILTKTADYSTADVKRSKIITSNHTPINTVDSALWILPQFTTLYAGLKNIFSLASVMSETENTKHTFYITSLEDVDGVKELVAHSFPSLKDAHFVNNPQYRELKDTAEFTIGLCSLWTTAYELLLNNNVKRKLYIIQDNETSFYPRGSIYGLVNATYDFGFWAIAGTGALKDWYLSTKGNRAIVLESDLDVGAYLRYGESNTAKKVNKKPRILFYARPDAPRNGFELGLNALNALAEKKKGEIDIVLAGADFDITQYSDLHPSIRLAGKVPYAQLAEFYASFDAALFLMFSEHPGVFALEMMASSCPVVINKHDNNSWNELYIDGETCLVAEPSVTSVAMALEQVVSDGTLRKKLITNGKSLARRYHDADYKTQATKALQFIKGNDK